MTILAGVAENNKLLATGDNTLLSPSASQRFVVSSAVFNETTGASETVELFIGTSATSVTAKRFKKMGFSPNEDKSPVAMFNRAIPASSFLIAKAAGNNLVNVDLTYTIYDGDDL